MKSVKLSPVVVSAIALLCATIVYTIYTDPSLNQRTSERTTPEVRPLTIPPEEPALKKIKLLRNFKKHVRQKAISELTAMGEPAIEPLVSELKRAKKYYLDTLINTLSKFGASAVEPLLAVLKEDDPRFRKNAIMALGRLKDVRSVEPLIAVLEKKTQTRKSLREEKQARVVIKAEKGVASPSKEKREEIIKAYKTLGKLSRYQRQESDVRAKAAQALGFLKDTRALAALIAALGDKEKNVAGNAAWALGALNDVRAVEPLIAALDGLGKKQAIGALGALKDARAIDPLIKNLQAWKPKSVIRALTNIGPAAVEPLMVALKHPYGGTRKHAAVILGAIKDARAVPALIAALSDREHENRKNVVNALAAINDPRAVAPLIAKLGDIDRYVRRSIARALGKLGNPSAIAPLSTRLADWNAGKANAAALIKLGWVPQTETETIYFLIAQRQRDKMKDVALWPAIKRVLYKDLKSFNRLKSWNAVNALISIGNDEAIPQLVAVLNHSINSTSIANLYLNLRNNRLSSATREWARKKGIKIVYRQVPKGTRSKGWGRF